MKILLVISNREEIENFYKKDWEGRIHYDDINAVEGSLKELGHDVKKSFADLGLIKKLKDEKQNIGLVFNLCDDGFFSNAQLEPHLPAILDSLGIPYTGSAYLCLSLCLNKPRTKEILIANKILTPKFQLFQSENEKLRNDFNFPLIVKPSHEDASIGIKDDSIVKDEPALRKKVKFMVEEYNQPALVEEFIDGGEFYVGIVGHDKKEVLPTAEVVFTNKNKPKILNYAAKWDEQSEDHKSIRKSCPANLNKGLEKRLGEIALKVYSLMQCRDYARIDFRVDKDENIFVLEVNPNPDISPEDWLHTMAKAKNYSYTELINKIIQSALQRYSLNKK